MKEVGTAIGNYEPDPADDAEFGTFVDQLPEPLLHTPNAVHLARPFLVCVTQPSSVSGLTCEITPIHFRPRVSGDALIRN